MYPYDWFLYLKEIIFSHSVLRMRMLNCVAPETPVHPNRIVFPSESTTLRFVTGPTCCSAKQNSCVNILHERYARQNKNIDLQVFTNLFNAAQVL